MNIDRIKAEYDRIARIQSNNSLPHDHVAICNVIAAQMGYRFMDVLASMEGRTNG